MWLVLSRKATDTEWMNVPCADAEGLGRGKGTGKRIGEDDNQVTNSLTQGQAGAGNDQGKPVD